jgi:hypothetical protein
MRRLFSHLAVILPVAALAVVGSLPTSVGAQATADRWPSSLRVGDTVRVWATRPPLSRAVGLMTRRDGDTLILGALPGRRASFRDLAVPFEAITRVEVHRGSRRSVGWTVAGVFLGLAGGALVGSVAGVTLECGGSCSDQGDLAGIAGFVIGGGLGALAGGIAGGIIGGQRRASWQPIALPGR